MTVDAGIADRRDDDDRRCVKRRTGRIAFVGGPRREGRLHGDFGPTEISATRGALPNWRSPSLLFTCPFRDPRTRRAHATKLAHRALPLPSIRMRNQKSGLDFGPRSSKCRGRFLDSCRNRARLRTASPTAEPSLPMLRRGRSTPHDYHLVPKLRAIQLERIIQNGDEHAPGDRAHHASIAACQTSSPQDDGCDDHQRERITGCWRRCANPGSPARPLSGR
jgi:hypothetical protein